MRTLNEVSFARYRRILLVSAAAAAFVGVPVAAAPPASACPSGFVTDPFTGQCYTPQRPTDGGRPPVHTG